MRQEAISNQKQIRELSVLVDAEMDAARNTALHNQIFDLNMRNELLHTGLNAIRNARSFYQGYEMRSTVRDFGLWVTDSGDSLNNPGPLVNEIAPFEKAKHLDLPAIVLEDQTGHRPCLLPDGILEGWRMRWKALNSSSRSQ